ncbi:MAG: cobalt transporter CbiM [Thermodesulfovibrionales bacterium]|nr:cobalt transporter CbiM [Thermodesulfovibrionales bacterium]
MHISEGVLSPAILLTGALLSSGGVAIGLKKMDFSKIPEVAVLSSAFFVASLIHVPIGPVNAHLVLNGLVGLLLGWMAFPSILVALFLQALLFQYGGLTTLGVNTFIMAAPAVIIYYLFSIPIKRGNSTITLISGFLGGALGIGFSSVLMSLSLLGTGEEFISLIKVVIVAHIPVMIVEGLITAFCVAFLKKLKPELVKA